MSLRLSLPPPGHTAGLWFGPSERSSVTRRHSLRPACRTQFVHLRHHWTGPETSHRRPPRTVGSRAPKVTLPSSPRSCTSVKKVFQDKISCLFTFLSTVPPSSVLPTKHNSKIFRPRPVYPTQDTLRVPLSDCRVPLEENRRPPISRLRRGNTSRN